MNTPSWTRRWPLWAPFAAGVWSGVYALVEVVWSATGTTVPWKPHEAIGTPVLLLFGALAVLGGTAGLATTRTLSRSGRRAVAVTLIAVVPVFVVGMASVPEYFVTLASLSGVESVTGLTWVLLNAAGTGLLVMVALSHRRRLAGRCPRCGQRHAGDRFGPLVHPDATVASRRARTTVYLLMCGLLPWAGVKTIWTLGGGALGVTAEGWRKVNTGDSAVARALSSVGIDVTVLAAAFGIFLLLGLLYPWGQIFPRWALPLAGRRVPRMLPLLPAWVIAAGLSLYGSVLVGYAPLSALGIAPPVEPSAPFTSRGRHHLDGAVRWSGLQRARLRPDRGRPLLRGTHPAGLRRDRRPRWACRSRRGGSDDR
ncbi:hypothetical protein [Streptomyces sp. SPB162]|uniref:hypothetical protein n=1 Tax=Streptomyces sp. SPB162 TaxID=2940560 RepID=UPI0024059EC7|nr:hypothetical protein [Streptomyces sp. SPB162]MDF9812852.1 lysylphosphatidylglycerol synthetase-like protein (DUF2156 family) [Streptomyces sp. SPB162]